MSLAARRFTEADQNWFARASGDANPLHVDRGWAERHFPGALVVHGVHALLWALDAHLRDHAGLAVEELTATFIKPILVGDEVQFDPAAEERAIRLLVRDEMAAVIRLPSPAPGPAVGEAVSEDSGMLRLPEASRELVEAFPRVAATLGPMSTRGLAALSTVVGMERPGLHGMLSEIKVRLRQPETEELAFGTRRWDETFNRLELQVAGFGLTGRIVAFAGRPAPEARPQEGLELLVGREAFAGQSPLVIGASSGLGAATARLLSAGGAAPVLAHRPGGNLDAIVSSLPQGAAYRTVEFDACEPAHGLAELTANGWCGGELYYFASPRIFRRRLEPYQAGDLSDFLRIYVDGFYETVRGLLRARPEATLSVFYPSTVALDDATPDLFEYRVAKAAGEELCERLARRHKRLSVLAARLPRIETRQTQSFLKVPAEAPERVMAPLVRRVQAAGRPAA